MDAAPSYRVLFPGNSEFCEPAVRQLGKLDPVWLEQLVWSSARGYAHLLIERRFSQLPRWKPQDRLDLAALVFPGILSKR